MGEFFISNYVFSKFERKIGRVSRDVWLKMLRIAHDFDLNKGGIYDARSGCINLWVAPEDKPSDYNFEITKGCLNFPREFLASIYGQYIDDKTVELYLTIYNYGRKDYAEHLFNEGKISWREYREMMELSEKGTDEEWRWAMEKAEWLIDIAEKESVFKEVVYCPFCGMEFPDLKLFNTFIAHLSIHTELRSITLGEEGLVIKTAKGNLTPGDYVKTVRKVKV